MGKIWRETNDFRISIRKRKHRSDERKYTLPAKSRGEMIPLRKHILGARSSFAFSNFARLGQDRESFCFGVPYHSKNIKE